MYFKYNNEIYFKYKHSSQKVKQSSETLARQINAFIKFPNQNGLNNYKREFIKSQFPGVIGLVDGTHIPIKSPGGVKMLRYLETEKGFSLSMCKL